MSFVIAAPEALVAVASDLAGIGSALAEANAAALAPTTALLAAGADEVSAAIAALFGAHGQAYQTVSAQASAFHAQFVQALTGGGGAYAAAEAANVSAAQSTDQRLLDLINGPTQALLGRPLIGDGANGGPGQDGGPGGLLYGNGGNGGTSTTAGVAGGNGGAAGLIGNGGGGGGVFFNTYAAHDNPLLSVWGWPLLLKKQTNINTVVIIHDYVTTRISSR
uniref:PE family protein n=1 Tax=Mycobacterium tuberculosis TaxID=1773 RepID=UPI001F432D29